MSDVLQRVKDTIRERALVPPSAPVVLMVSGGSDSTALAYIAHELSVAGKIGPLAMLHVNHQLRGEDADADAAFVAELAQALDMPLFSISADVAGEAARTGENIEAAGRRIRYSAAQDALHSLCLQFAQPLADGRIFTAHTQDDRVESFYMRSIVGTGPGGFRSMLYRNGPVVRPLLDTSREALRAYIEERAGELGLPVVRDADGALWREDATNAHTDHFRAWVRHEVLPLMKQKNPQLLDTLCRSMNLVGDEDDMLDEHTNRIIGDLVAWEDVDGDRVVDYEAGCVILPAFGALPLPIQRRVAFQVLQYLLGPDARVETATITAITDAFGPDAPRSGYTNNIQGNLAISANKRGLRIEPMEAYRIRRKRTSTTE